jgi:hypothetical protein
MHRRWRIVRPLIFVTVAMLSAALSFAQVRLPEVTVTAPWGGLSGGSLELERESTTA